MKHGKKTDEQIKRELEELRKQVVELEAKYKQKEEACLRSEERFQRLSEASFEGICIHESGKIIDANEIFAKTCGYKLSEVIGMNPLELSAPESRELILKNINSGYEKPYEVVGLKKDGSTFPVEICGRTILYNGRSMRVVVLRDISDRKWTEKALKKHQQRLEASEKELKNFSRRILSIREEEKKNLSTSLHDEVGSMSIALSSSLTAIEEEVKNNNTKSALEAIAKSKTTLRKMIQRFKKIAADLRPPDLDIMGLTGALREYFSNMTKQTDISINFHENMEEKKINDNVSIVLFRIVQEALNNTIKHSNAKTVKVTLHSRQNEIELNVCDNGKGFDIVKSLKVSKIHMGIRGMKEMVESVKGVFTIQSAPEKGTEIRVTIPNIEDHRS